MRARRFSRPARRSLAARSGLLPRWWHTRDGITRERPPRGDDADEPAADERQWQIDAEDIRAAFEANPERVRRLADAVEEGGDVVRRLAEEWGIPYGDDGLMDVADAAGVTPLADVDGGQLVDELQRWLREQG